jgi:hypothetical protein
LLERRLAFLNIRQPSWLLGALLGILAASLVVATFVLGARNDYSLFYLSLLRASRLVHLSAA